jgi:ketosteroid isomerase-like protein
MSSRPTTCSPARPVLVVLFGLLAFAATAHAQLLTPADPGTPNPLVDTTVSPGKALLFELEAHFAKATAEGGGKAFVTFFADDAITLSDGSAPVHGRDAIAKRATWSPKDYQLTWTPTDAVMSPAGNMGYTWGHYEGRSRDADGQERLTSGRYMTIWRKEPNGEWKVILDASNNEPAGAGDCCKLPSN